MARLSDDAQWIIMIGFVVSISIFFLALIIDESTVVGQTTAEGVLEFPKHDIQNLKEEIFFAIDRGKLAGNTPNGEVTLISQDIEELSLLRMNSMIIITPNPSLQEVQVHFNNGVTTYDGAISYER